MRKSNKIRYMFVLAVCCMAFLQCEGVSYAETVGIVTTSNSGLNMREGAGTKYAIMISIPEGSQVTVLDMAAGSDANGTWYKVCYDGKEGYVAGKYITLGADASPNVTVSPTSTPQPSATQTPTVIYRTKTTYKDIKIPATVSKKNGTIYRTATGKKLKINKKSVVLKKNKRVTIVGEKTKKDKKWFKVQFKYKKKTRTGYLLSTEVKMTLKNAAAGKVANTKSVIVKKKPGQKKANCKINGRNLVLAKKQYVSITKVRKVKGVQWYKISFEYYGKTYSGFVPASNVAVAKKRVQTKEKVTALNDKQFEEEMTRQGFPESYKTALRKLHATYPHWQFQSYKTGLDWNAAVEGESKIGLNLISNSKSAGWKSTEEGAYDAATGKWTIFEGSTWVAASKDAVRYYMDPRNFLTVQGIYQFELLEYQSEYQTLDGINQILKNTPFYGKSFTYTDDVSGTEQTISYAKAFETAAKQSGVSPYHLASRSKQEVVTGTSTVSTSVTGENATYPGIYNFYNIGANTGALDGLAWASTGTTYLRPWNNRYRSIVGGAMYIGSKYIERGQNTGYLQKFNVTPNTTYGHQYMANIEAANSESLKTKNGYNGMLDSVPLVFSIPVYENMPETNCPAPQ